MSPAALSLLSADTTAQTAVPPQSRLLLAKSQDAAFCLQTSTAALHVCLREESDLRL